MRPMPRPAPMIASPIPMPAPSSALLLSAVSGVAWSSMSRLCISSPGKVSRAWCVVRGAWSMLVPHQSNEDRCQQSEDIGLQERHQQLEKHHEQCQRDGARHHAVANHGRRGAEDEDEAEEHEDHEVPRRHVREKSQGQRERLDEFADQLDGRHDDRHDDGADAFHARRHHHDGLQVPLGTERAEAGDLDRQKGGQREPGGHGDVAGGGGAPGQQPQQIAVQNEEEERQDVGRKDFPAVPDARDRDVVPDEQDHGLDGGADAARCLAFAVAPIDLSPTPPDREPDEERGEEHEDDVLGRRHIDVGARDVPGTRQRLLPDERQLDHMAVAGVMEDHRADIGFLHHLRNLVSRNKSGNSTPTYPSRAGTVRDTIRTIPTPRNRIPMPPSQRAINSGLGARSLGLSRTTAQSWARTAIPPPIAAGSPPSAVATATNPTPRATRMTKAFTSRPFTASYRPLPPLLSMSFFTR